MTKEDSCCACILSPFYVKDGHVISKPKYLACNLQLALLKTLKSFNPFLKSFQKAFNPLLERSGSTRKQRDLLHLTF